MAFAAVVLAGEGEVQFHVLELPPEGLGVLRDGFREVSVAFGLGEFVQLRGVRAPLSRCRATCRPDRGSRRGGAWRTGRLLSRPRSRAERTGFRVRLSVFRGGDVKDGGGRVRCVPGALRVLVSSLASDIPPPESIIATGDRQEEIGGTGRGHICCGRVGQRRVHDVRGPWRGGRRRAPVREGDSRGRGAESSPRPPPGRSGDPR